MSKSNPGAKRQLPLRSKLLFALCIALPLIPFSTWVFLLSTICSNPRAPVPETHHVNAYSCHGTTVYISDLENAMLHWIIPIGGVVLILLGILAGAAAVLSMASVQVDAKIKVTDVSSAEDRELMGTLKDIVEFRSNDFVPFLPDEAQVNPAVYGAELAFWLSSSLAGRGLITSYPRSEDWGWYIEYSTGSGSGFAIHCGNVDGSKDRWLLSLRRLPRKMFGRDKPRFSEASQLVAGVRDAVYALNSASEIVWRWEESNT